MFKNNKGVTLIALIVTIIILTIISGVSLVNSSDFLKKSRISRIISNMELVQAKVENIYEEYQFSPEENPLIGTQVQLNVQFSSEESNLQDEELKWYKWNQDVLRSQNLDPKMLAGNSEYFYVNYENSEVLYSEGTIVEDLSGNKKTIYSLTALKKALVE